MSRSDAARGDLTSDDLSLEGVIVGDEGEILEQGRKKYSSGQIGESAEAYHLGKAGRRAARRTTSKPLCESDMAEIQQDMVKTDRLASDVLTQSPAASEQSPEAQPTPSPPPYPTAPLSASQSEGSDASTFSPFDTSSPTLPQGTPTHGTAPHIHRAYQQARNRAKLSITGGVRSRKKTDPASLALKDQATTIKFQRMEIRALEAEKARIEAEKSAGVYKEQIETMRETIRANKAEEEVRVLGARISAMEAMEVVKAEAEEKVSEASLEAAKARMEAEAQVQAAEEKINALEEEARAWNHELAEARSMLSEAYLSREDLEQTKNMVAHMMDQLATTNLKLKDTKAQLEKAKQETASAYGKWVLVYGQRKATYIGEKFVLDQGLRRLGGGGRGGM